MVSAGASVSFAEVLVGDEVLRPRGTTNIWVNYNDLTRTTFFQIGEILYFTQKYTNMSLL